MKKVVLVTGGTGLVGSAIQRYVKNINGCEWLFVGSELDLASCDYTRIFNFFKKYRPSYVIHLAAKVGGLYRNARSNFDMFTSNMIMNQNIMRVCEEFAVEKVILCLSTCIYPDKIQSYPFDEKVLHEGPPHPSNEGYAYAKRMLEVQARLFNSSSKQTKMICVIPTNIYGPHDNFNLEDSHVIPGLIHQCYLAVKNGTNFKVRGSGKALRQFIHADDVARAVVKILLELHEYNDILKYGIILAPSADSEISITDIVCLIADDFGLNANRIEFDKTYSDGQIRKTASNNLMMSCFPSFEFKNLQSGIKETVKWFIENYDLARK